MINLAAAYDEVAPELDAIDNWCNDIYIQNFAMYFDDAKELFEKLQASGNTITDAELSWILIQLPLKLFDVAEVLNQFRVKQEAMKLKNKYEADKVKVTAETADWVVERKLLVTAVSSVVTRVENEISMSRELIMGAKKIWDSRRRTDNLMPVSEAAVTLPDYIEED